jgi:hypothetical protein
VLHSPPSLNLIWTARTLMILARLIRSFVAACIVFGFVRGEDDSTCVFDDGQEYQPGDDVGDSFTNRCGNSTDFPCFCDPTVSFQAYCPYCGFAAGDGTLHCARDGETVSFPDGSITRECSCTFSDDPTDDPTRNCTIVDDDQPEEEDPPSGPPATGEGGQCVLPDADDNMVEFDNGESFGELIEGACGPASEWPSFCNVLDDEGGFDIEYPYCVQNDLQSGETLCAKDGESISYVNADGVNVTCACVYTSDGGPDSQCEDSGGESSPPDPQGESTSPPSNAPVPSGSSGDSCKNRLWPLLLPPLIVLLHRLQCY